MEEGGGTRDGPEDLGMGEEDEEVDEEDVGLAGDELPDDAHCQQPVPCNSEGQSLPVFCLATRAKRSVFVAALPWTVTALCLVPRVRLDLLSYHYQQSAASLLLCYVERTYFVTSSLPSQHCIMISKLLRPSSPSIVLMPQAQP